MAEDGVKGKSGEGLDRKIRWVYCTRALRAELQGKKRRKRRKGASRSMGAPLLIN